MKTYNERTQDILAKVDAKKKINRRRIAALTTFCCFAVIAGLVLFMPHNTQPPSVIQHAGNEYYELIQKLNKLTDTQLSDQILDGGIGNIVTDVNTALGVPGADMAPGLPEEAPGYEEITDNQVTGVIEGDRIKRSSEYIYYLREQTLSVYSIAGEASAEVGCFFIDDADGFKLSAYTGEWEMFLSDDCTTVTMVSSCYHHDKNEKFVCVVSLDVTDPANIKENGRTYLTGSYMSARLVGQELLLISKYSVGNNPDFSDESQFVPQYGDAENMQSVPMAGIIAPDELANTRYTVICKLDQKTLEVSDTAAFLSYANEVYVSADKIFATRNYLAKTELDDGKILFESRTEISAISYTGEKMAYLGSVDVAGSVLNQYSMDEYDGILRVVTTTNSRTYKETTQGDVAVMEPVMGWIGTADSTSASLYCIDLATWQVTAAVEQFAPAGEEVQSVRFDGESAYVCTAVVLTDPVFFFDLSDLNNITYKDTGTIDGYSSSLVDFVPGYLLGIGYGDSWDTLKIEIYEESIDSVVSVCKYEVENCYFSEDYKAYYIDRSNQYIGLGINDERYVLLHFDGYELVELADVACSGHVSYMRGVVIDGYLYAFGQGFAVAAI